MAHNNYSQPYYGAPFQYPPPLQQQSAPHVPSNPSPAPQDHQHAPAVNPFYLPGLHHAYNANHASYSQNQHPPFSPAAWPPPDPNAFLAFMQSASMNGAPPPMPGFGFPPAAPPAFPPPPVLPPPSDRVQEVMDSDREDGEVSDSDGAPQVNGPSYPEPPRSVPQTKPTSYPAEEAYNPDHPAAGQLAVKESSHKASHQAVIPSPVNALQQNRDQAKQFIKLLHSNNIGYRTLAKESLDLEQLRGLYQSLNLPSEPAPILPLQAPVASPKAAGQAPSVSPIPPTIKTNMNVVPPTASAPSPVDRKDYIARLQAAKLAKQAATAKPSPPQKTPIAVAPPIVDTPPPAATPTSKPPVTDEQRARNTELIKQRLEAIKAKKQMTPVVNGTSSVSGTINQTAQPIPSGTTTPKFQTQAPGFPGIPGLFMNNPPIVDNGNAKLTPSIPLKRPAPSESTEVSTPRSSVTPYTRPLGDSPHVYHDEPMIIQVSDEESTGSDMDIDHDQSHPKSTITSQLGNSQRQAPGTLPDFPSRPPSVFPDSSAVSTPGPQTPATQAREKELKRKEDELAAMRLTLKRKLAEKREKDKAAAAAVAAAAASLATPSVLESPSTQHMRVLPGGCSNNVLNDTSELISDVKRRRREEIQSKLPSYDAELAVNSTRMAQLMQEMEELRVQNMKITEDKERLTRELENLGVDTEGMSHAEMRAKKDEIDHEKSPEPEAAHQEAKLPELLPIERENDVTRAFTVPTRPDESLDTAQHTTLPGLKYHAPQESKEMTAPSQISTVHELPRSMNTTAAAAETQSQKLPIFTEDLAATTNATATSQPQDFATPLDEEDDFYSPVPVVGANISEAQLHEDRVPTQATSHATSLSSPRSEEGEVEMSLASEDEDEEEEYVPDEPMTTETPLVGDAQVGQSKVASSIGTDEVSTEDEEEPYEPPDVDEEMPHGEVDSEMVEVHTAAAQADVGDDAMDIASSSSEDSDVDSESDTEDSSEARNDDSISASSAVQQNTNVADDLVPELQYLPGPEVVVETEDDDGVAKFTPYQSPLRMFKSYRYHPNFAQEVSGGFLSNTFSHQIDADRVMCQFETSGGTCNDADCPYQHFRGMGITGETLLVQLGTANPGKTTEQKQQWNDGLRGVLKELRKKSIKDPNGIAAEIAKYRRQFLNDDTRVVNL